jgi:hypothetical protein
MVQIACFNVFEPNPLRKTMRELVSDSLDDAESSLKQMGNVLSNDRFISIREFIPLAMLRRTDELDITEEEIAQYNAHLQGLFADKAVVDEWARLFEPSFLLENEERLFKEILGACY